MLYERAWSIVHNYKPKNVRHQGLTITLDNTEALQKYMRKFRKLGDTNTLKGLGKWAGEQLGAYAPKNSGKLRKSFDVLLKRDTFTVTWEGPHSVPYAHYQYMGIIYNYNHIRWKNGLMNGWYSSPAPKTPDPDRRMIPNWRHTLFTTKENGHKYICRLGYTTPNTTHHWIDEIVRVPTRYYPFKKDMTQYLKAKFEEIQ